MDLHIHHRHHRGTHQRHRTTGTPRRHHRQLGIRGTLRRGIRVRRTKGTKGTSHKGTRHRHRPSNTSTTITSITVTTIRPVVPLSYKAGTPRCYLSLLGFSIYVDFSNMGFVRCYNGNWKKWESWRYWSEFEIIWQVIFMSNEQPCCEINTRMFY